jgi:hypothetical protein
LVKKWWLFALAHSFLINFASLPSSPYIFKLVSSHNFLLFLFSSVYNIYFRSCSIIIETRIIQYSVWVICTILKKINMFIFYNLASFGYLIVKIYCKKVNFTKYAFYKSLSVVTLLNTLIIWSKNYCNKLFLDAFFHFMITKCVKQLSKFRNTYKHTNKTVKLNS